MKILPKPSLLLLLFLMICFAVFSQTFNTIDKAKTYFQKLDDEHNIAMVKQDSTFLKNYYADKFINCTRSGEINNKPEEINSLNAMTLTKVVRVAPQYDVFTYSGDLCTFSVVKKLSWKDLSVTYVRRTIVFQLIKGKWQAVSGQGTHVQAKYFE